jgi:hypothetical protein
VLIKRSLKVYIYVELLAITHDLKAGREPIEGYLAGTRTRIINDILISLRNSSTQTKILLLKAAPGTGKSYCGALPPILSRRSQGNAYILRYCIGRPERK